jgi:hypothetical protein
MACPPPPCWTKKVVKDIGKKKGSKAMPTALDKLWLRAPDPHATVLVGVGMGEWLFLIFFGGMLLPPPCCPLYTFHPVATFTPPPATYHPRASPPVCFRFFCPESSFL